MRCAYVDFMAVFNASLMWSSSSDKLCVDQNLPLDRIIPQMGVVKGTQNGEHSSLQTHLEVDELTYPCSSATTQYPCMLDTSRLQIAD